MKALLVGVCSPRPGSGIERGGLMVAAALQRLKKSFMNFALSRRRRRLERAFPSVPLADFILIKANDTCDNFIGIGVASHIVSTRASHNLVLQIGFFTGIFQRRPRSC
jgi:hypothetical protein